MRRALVFGVWVVALGLGVHAQARSQEEGRTADLTGTWQVDPKHSDLAGGAQRTGPPPGMERGGFGGGAGGFGGGMGGARRGPRRGGGPGMEPGAASGGPRGHLPDRIHVTQTASLVSLEDSSGAVFREIATVAAEADTFLRAPGAEHVPGRWSKGRLEVERPGPFEDPIRESYALEADGRRLVVRVRLPGNTRMPAREIKRVYLRVEEGGS